MVERKRRIYKTLNISARHSLPSYYGSSMVSSLLVLVFALGQALATYATFIPIVPHLHSPNTFQQLIGTPAGTTVKIGGVDTYVSLPQGRGRPKDEAILLLTDVFGLALVNNKLLVSLP